MSYYSNIILNSHPIAYYRLDDTIGNVALDLSGNGYNATYEGTYTLNQPGIVANDTDTSALFDGITGILQLPVSLGFTTWTSFTLCFWLSLNGVISFQAITCDGQTTSLYENGILIASRLSGSTVLVGGTFEWAGSPVTGIMDEVALFKNTLVPVATLTYFYQVGSNTLNPWFPKLPTGLDREIAVAQSFRRDILTFGTGNRGR